MSGGRLRGAGGPFAGRPRREEDRFGQRSRRHLPGGEGLGNGRETEESRDVAGFARTLQSVRMALSAKKPPRVPLLRAFAWTRRETPPRGGLC